jgi:hypothetical protein
VCDAACRTRPSSLAWPCSSSALSAKHERQRRRDAVLAVDATWPAPAGSRHLFRADLPRNGGGPRTPRPPRVLLPSRPRPAPAPAGSLHGWPGRTAVASVRAHHPIGGRDGTLGHGSSRTRRDMTCIHAFIHVTRTHLAEDAYVGACQARSEDEASPHIDPAARWTSLLDSDVLRPIARCW